MPSLRPVAVAFVALGVFFGTWAVVAADAEDALGVSHGGFGVLLAVALTGTVTTSTITGSLVERLGTTRVLRLGLVGFGVAALAIGAAGAQPVLLGAAILAVFSWSGVVDVTMNVAAAGELADRPGQLVRFHAFFNAGAAGGAAATAVLIHFADEWRWTMVLPAGAMAVAYLASRRGDVPAVAAGEHHGLLHSFRTVRREHLTALAAVFACSALVEGGIDTWGVLVLRDQLEISVVVGAVAYLIGQTVATTSRAVLGPAAGKLGTARGVGLGSGLATVGLVLVGVGPAPVAAIGLVLAATGVSVCWPMLLAHASQGLERPAGVVSGVTAIGYIGFVVGPVLIGFIAELTSLRGAVLALAVVAAGVAIAPSRLRPAATSP